MVLTRGDFSHPDVTVIRSLDEVSPRLKGRTAYIAGGAQIYEQALPQCGSVADTGAARSGRRCVFPTFEDQFEEESVLRVEPEFSIVHYRNRSLAQGD